MNINLMGEPRQFEELELACISLQSSPPAEIALTVLGNDDYHDHNDHYYDYLKQ